MKAIEGKVSTTSGISQSSPLWKPKELNHLATWRADRKKTRREDLHLPALYSLSNSSCLRRYFVPNWNWIEPLARLIWNV